MLALKPSLCRPAARVSPTTAHRRTRHSSTLTHAAAPPPTTTLSSSSSFAEAASGEWEGAAASFNRTGEPVELPPRYVPEAFREWGVEVADWQTQCSTECVPGGGGDGDDGGSTATPRVSHRLKRLLPSVGCEADATAFMDEGVDDAPTATLPDGAYALAPPSLPTDPAARPACFEVALPLPPAACVAADGSVSPRRVRAVLTLAADPTSESDPAPPILTGVELFSEKRYGPYAGGTDSLAGCGGGVAPFARGARLEGGSLERGDWRVEAGVRAGVYPPVPPAVPAPDPARGSPAGLRLLLPLGAWAAVRPASGGGGGAGARGVTVEAGLVAGGGGAGGLVRRSGAATFDAGGLLVSVELVAETAAGGRLS